MEPTNQAQEKVLYKTNNLILLGEFYNQISAHLQDPSLKRHLDIGHGKDDLRFSKFLAYSFSDREIVYFDNSDIISRIKNRWTFGRTLPSNLTLTSSLQPPFDSMSYFFTHHEFLRPQEDKEALLRNLELLRKGGLIFIIDYDLAWVRNTEDPEAAFRKIFNSHNEKKVIEAEKDYLAAHTSYSLDQCVSDLENLGIRTLERISTNPRKLFLYAGVKT